MKNHHEPRARGFRYTHYTVAAGAICLIALLLRIFALGRNDLQFDELFFLLKVHPRELFGLSTQYCNPRPLFIYNLFINYWQVLGSTAFILRLPSVLFGTAACFMMYALGREIFDRETGVIASAVLAVSSFHLLYSQELSSPSLVVLLTLVSLYGFWKWMSSGKARFLAVYLAANLIGMYVSFLFAMTPFMQAVAAFAHRKRIPGAGFCRWIISQIIILVFLIPWFYIFSVQLGRTIGLIHASPVPYAIVPFNTSVSLANIVYSLKNFSTGYYAPAFLRISGFVLMAGLFLYGAGRLFITSRRLFLTLAWFMFFPMLCLVAISRGALIYADRYVFTGMIFFYLIAAQAVRIMAVKRMIFAAGAAVCLSVTAVFSLGYYYTGRYCVPTTERQGMESRKEFKKAAWYVAERLHSDDALVHLSEDSLLPFEYYAGEAGRRTGGTTRLEMIPMSGFLGFVEDYFFTFRSLPKLAVHDLKNHSVRIFFFDGQQRGRYSVGSFPGRSCRRIWVVYSGRDGSRFAGLLDCLEFSFSGSFEREETQDFGSVRVLLYGRKDTAEIP